MQKLLALLVLLGMVSVVRADDAAIVKRLKTAGVSVTCSQAGALDVDIDGSSVDVDAVLPELCELRHLQSVYMAHTALTDTQVRQLRDLPELRSLSFLACPLNEAQLKIVVRARGLHLLNLCDTPITDVALAELARLPDLKELILEGATVTDAGLRHLEEMQGLQDLHLLRCPNVTDEGVARLRKVLPNCKVRH
jgi:hypothetical protein